jgi:PKD repeat protein
MKKLIFLIVFLGFSLFLFSQQSEIIPLSVNHNKLEFKGFTPTAFSAKVQMKELKATNKVIENREFASIDLEGFASTGTVGQAGVPTLSRMIEVPHGAEVQVLIHGYTQEVVNLSEYGINRIEPVQPSYSKSTPIEEQYFVIDENYYNTDLYDTEDIVKVEIYGTMRGVRIAGLTIRPYHYNPVENTLIVYNDLDFEIKFLNADLALTEQMKNRYYSPEFAGAYSELINFSAPAAKDQLTNFSAPLKYVIVANQAFQTTLQPFVQWKTKQGFNVIEHYVASGTTNTTIKNYLQGLYDAGTASDPAPIYCLIIGDHSGTYSIPAFATKVSGESHITDLYFACFDGTSDYLPDMYYGRISAESTTELQNALDKILPYQQYSLSNFDYLDKALLVAGVDSYWANKCGNAAILYATNNYINTAHGFANIYAYYYNTTSYPYSVMRSNSSSASGDINSKIGAGVGFGNYTAHCDHDGWSDPAVRRSNVPNWANKNKYPFLIGNCCLSFQFNKSDAFGEVLLHTKDAGAVGYIGTTNYSYWYEDTYWGLGLVSQATVDAGNITAYNTSNTGLGFMDGVFHEHYGDDHANWYYTASQIITCGNLAVQASSETSRKQYYWEIYHVSGDPSLIPYMTKPDPLTLTFTPPFVGATTLTVNTEPYTYVAISKNNVLLDAKWSGSGSTVTLNFPALTGENHCVVGTKQDRAPYINESVLPTVPSVPVANFSASPTTILEGETVSFTDASQYAASWSWNFGDGQTSTEQNPSHVYTAAGTYTVSLTVTNTLGSDTETKNNYITVNINTNPPTADFTASQTNIIIGTTVGFTDLSINNPTGWSWEFEGGTPATSTEQNPSVVYNTPGTYKVKLTASNTYGSDVEEKLAYITVTLPTYCSAGSNNASYKGISNFTCNTINNSSGKSTYTDFTHISTDLLIGQSYPFSITTANGYTSDQVLIWVDWNRDGDFIDDGENVFSGNGQGPFSGNITVPSTVTQGEVRVRIRLHDTGSSYNPNATPCGNSGYGEVEDYTFNLISPNIPPVADFAISGPAFCSGEVSFTDMSSLADSWLWSFGDGNTSVAQNPTHSYASSGTYTVSLTVTNGYGNDQKIVNDAVVIDIPEAPQITNANRCGTGSVNLSASGSGVLNWYDSEISGNLIHTGNTYTTPALSSTTTYYVQDNIGIEQNVGPNVGGSAKNVAAILYFDVYQPMTLISVDARAGGFTGGTKTIKLLDAENNELYSESVYVGTSTTTLTLNWEIQPGNGYQLTTKTNSNLYRISTANYPYTIDGLVSITGCNQGSSYYYSWFNWKVKGEDCISPRVPVTATINPVPSVNLGADQSQCGGSVTLNAGSGFNSYSWNGNPGTQTLVVNTTGNYSVVVENEFGCTASDNVNVTINQVPQLNLTAIDESAPNANDGSVTANVSGGATPYTYNWTGSSGTGNQITGLSDGTYCVTVTDGNGCSVGDCAIVETTAVPPVADFSANQTSACGSIVVQFTDNSLYSPTSWLWNFGDGNTSTAQNPTYTYSTAGIYSVSLTVTNSEGSNTETKTNYISVYENPTVVLTATPESVDVTNDGSVTVDVNGGAIPYSYSWSNSGTGSQIAGLSAGTYCVTVTDNNGCSVEDCAIVTLAGVAPISDFTADQTSACGSITVNFTDNSQYYPTSWSWDFGDGETSIAQNPTHTYSTAGVYTVSLTATNVEGSSIETKTGYITVYANPTVVLTATNVSWDATNNGSVTADVSGGAEPYTYQWSSSTETGSQIAGLSVGEYCVTVTDNNGCISSECINVGQDAEPAIPQVDFNANITLACLGYEIQFSDLSTNQPTTWLWDFGDGNTSTEENPTHIYENSGFYSVSLVVENEFGSNQLLKENYIYISNPPSLEVETIPASGEFVNDGSANIIITGGTAPYQIVWSNDEIGTSIENLMPGDYSVMVVDAAQCVVTEPFVISWTTAISQVETKINIFPNPAKDFVSVEIEGFKANKIYLTNVVGQIVSEITPTSNICTIDTQGVKPGMYSIKIEYENGISTHKLVIQ